MTEGIILLPHLSFIMASHTVTVTVTCHIQLSYDYEVSKLTPGCLTQEGTISELNFIACTTQLFCITFLFFSFDCGNVQYLICMVLVMQFLQCLPAYVSYHFSTCALVGYCMQLIVVCVHVVCVLSMVLSVCIV